MMLALIKISTHSIGFYGEIRKLAIVFFLLKRQVANKGMYVT